MVFVLGCCQLNLFNFKAIANGGQKYNVYDSRAATFERLGNIKAALHDSRKVIDLAPEMRQVSSTNLETSVILHHITIGVSSCSQIVQ